MMDIRTILVAIMALLAVGGAADAKVRTKPAYPTAIQGIWFADDADGRMGCKLYLDAYRKLDGTARDFLIGAEVIGPEIWHSYAEYGEGNFYKIQRLTTLGPGSWRIAAFIGIDSLPEAGDSETDIFRIGLKQGKLNWVLESAGKKKEDSGGKISLFRCAVLPKQ